MRPGVRHGFRIFGQAPGRLVWKGRWHAYRGHGAGRSGLAAARFLASQGALRRADGPPAPGPIPHWKPIWRSGVFLVYGVIIQSHFWKVAANSSSAPESPHGPLRSRAISRGIRVVGEVELAHRAIRERKDGSRILAVTGTNGKSTTTDLVAHLLKSSGIPAIACGNLVPP